jgi:hypothetical protein
MNDRALDAFARQAAGAISRRGSLLTLGGAALAASLARPGLISAKKHKKKRKKQECPAPPPPPTCPQPPAPPTCGQVCPITCDHPDPVTFDEPFYCFTRQDGPLLCGTGGDPDCATSCSSDNDCIETERPYCVTDYTIMDSGQFSTICGGPGAHCTRITACVP